MRSMREDCDGNVEKWLEWETTQEPAAVVQARSNSSELGQVSQNGEDEVNLRGTSEGRQQDLATDWTKDINGNS